MKVLPPQWAIDGAKRLREFAKDEVVKGVSSPFSFAKTAQDGSPKVYYELTEDELAERLTLSFRDHARDGFPEDAARIKAESHAIVAAAAPIGIRAVSDPSVVYATGAVYFVAVNNAARPRVMDALMVMRYAADLISFVSKEGRS